MSILSSFIVVFTVCCSCCCCCCCRIFWRFVRRVVHLPPSRRKWKAMGAIDLHSKCRYGARIYEFILHTYFVNFWPVLVHLPPSSNTPFVFFARLKLDPKPNFKFITRNIHSVANFSIRWISKAQTDGRAARSPITHMPSVAAGTDVSIRKTKIYPAVSFLWKRRTASPSPPHTLNGAMKLNGGSGWSGTLSHL